jgi:hypothetical protein
MPIYDWDFVKKYGDNTIIENLNPFYLREDLPPIEHYLISFNEFEDKKEDDDGDSIVASSFKG